MRQHIPNRDWIAGAVLILIGLTFLARNVAPDLERFVPLIVGLVLLVAFVATRALGALVPGAIVTGIGAGIVLATSGDRALGGGLFMLWFAAGFALIWLFGLVIGLSERQDWALVPAGILLAIGAVIIAANQGPASLQLLATWWPVVLIVLGAVVLVTSRRPRAGAPAGERTLGGSVFGRFRRDAEPARDADKEVTTASLRPTRPLDPRERASSHPWQRQRPLDDGDDDEGSSEERDRSRDE